MSSFSRGFSSVLNLYGNPDKEDLLFEFRGAPVESISTEEALTSDWSSVMGTVITIDDSQDDE